MSFVEERLNIDIGASVDATGGPEFKTSIVEVYSGHEGRNAAWDEGRGKWELGERMVGQIELEYLTAFFRARRGKAWGFRFKNWADFTFTDSEVGIGDGVEQYFQVVKNYATTLGSPELKALTKLVNGTLTVKIDDVGAGGWTVDINTGIIRFSVAPLISEVITVTGEYDVAVRFDTDHLRSQHRAYQPNGQDLHWLFALPLMEILV